MNVGNIGNAYGAYNYTNKVQNNNGKSFGAALGNVTEMASPNLTLHISKEGDAEKSIGSWANVRSGNSVSVYEPEDYNPADPVYKMKIWDKEDNLIEEREIRVKDIDPQNADSYELYALSVYGEKSGQNKNAVLDFVLSQDFRESEQYDSCGSYDLNTKENWLDIVSKIMKQQFEVGSMDGYMRFKGFYDFLADK